MNRIFKIANFISLLNVDVSFGACGICLLASKYLDVDTPFWAYLLLFLATFSIYLLDHLLDQLKLKHQLLTGRRLFYQTNAKFLFALLILAIGVGLGLAIKYIPHLIFLNACKLICICVAYFYINSRQKTTPFPKEFSIAILYSVGVFFYPINIYEGKPQLPLILFFGAMLVIAFENLLLYSIIEHEEDKNFGFDSIATRLGLSFCKQLLHWSFIFNFVLICWLLIINAENWIYILLLGLLCVAQLFVYMQREKLTKYSLYRWLADGAFMLPFALLVLS